MIAGRVVTLCKGVKHGLFRTHQLSLRSNLTTSAKQLNKARASRVAGKIGIKRTSWKEKLMAPDGDFAFGIRMGVVAVCSVLGFRVISPDEPDVENTVSLREKYSMWPQYVKDRVRSIYLYFGGSLAISAAAAVGVFRTPALLRLVSHGTWGMVVSMGAVIGTTIVCWSIPYTEGFGAKQIAWIVHSCSWGCMLAPAYVLLGGPPLTRAAMYTAGLVGGLSGIAVCEPREKYLNWGAPPMVGLGLVAVSLLANANLPASPALGAELSLIYMYGLIVILSSLMLYDTQNIMKKAELTPYNSDPPFDPIKWSMSFTLDVLAIFTFLGVTFSLPGMLAKVGGGKRK